MHNGQKGGNTEDQQCWREIVFTENPDGRIAAAGGTRSRSILMTPLYSGKH